MQQQKVLWKFQEEFCLHLCTDENVNCRKMHGDTVPESDREWDDWDQGCHTYLSAH